MASGLNLKVAQIEPKSDSKSGTVSTETGGAIRPKQVAQIEPYYPWQPQILRNDLNSMVFFQFQGKVFLIDL
jgi:hypothetical protein